MSMQSKPVRGPAEHLFDCGTVPTCLPTDCSAFARTWQMPGEGKSRPRLSSTTQEAATEDIGVGRLAWMNCPHEVP